jgi:hypothetical protein
MRWRNFFAAPVPFRGGGAGGTPTTDVVLFLHALRLCRSAKGTGSRTSLPQQAADLASKAWLPAGVAPDAAQRATIRASRRAARWLGSRDTCLIRSVVSAALLSDHDDVLLHVGFAPSGEGGRAIEGHAWVTVDGAIVGGPESAMAGDRPMTEMTIPVRRRRPPDRSSPIGGTIASP